jgi:U4/U6.U5 tri-snRNP-associated protein 1
MEVDIKPVIPNLDANFVDDDELQAALAKARSQKLRKDKKILRPEEIAQRCTFLQYCL